MVPGSRVCKGEVYTIFEGLFPYLHVASLLLQMIWPQNFNGGTVTGNRTEYFLKIKYGIPEVYKHSQSRLSLIHRFQIPIT